MNRAALLATFALAAVPPLHADHPTNVACTLAAVFDPTGTEQQRLGARTVQAGPWRVDEDRVRDVVVTCSLQFDSTDPAAPDVATASSAPAPVGVLPPAPVAYVKPPGTPVYLCTDVTWIRSDGTTEHQQVDADAVAPGVQCDGTVELSHGCADTGPGILPARRCHPILLPGGGGQ